jgi:hypothetical protein
LVAVALAETRDGAAYVPEMMMSARATPALPGRRAVLLTRGHLINPPMHSSGSRSRRALAGGAGLAGRGGGQYGRGPAIPLITAFHSQGAIFVTADASVLDHNTSHFA